MLSSVIHKISNYFFVRFENYIANKRKNELETIISEFKNIGLKFNIGKDYSIINPKYIEIGDNFSAKERFRIEAWDKFHDQLFSPNIKIGNNVIFNTDIHIGCINSIVIGDNCLFASRIYITDHDHGDTTAQILNTAPSLRPLQTKGPVIIEDNVWIGEGVAIVL